MSLAATPEKNWKFIEWSGGIQGTNAQVGVVVTNNLLVQALFEPSYKLSVPVPQDLSIGLRLVVEADPGGRYGIDFSSGLQSWTPLVTLTNQTGTLDYLDTQARALSRRFYRIRPLDN